eukprot:SAG11_NODE_1204_length_5531_cov_3.137518_2_plen_64_part_00
MYLLKSVTQRKDPRVYSTYFLLKVILKMLDYMLVPDHGEAKTWPKWTFLEGWRLQLTILLETY